MALRFGGPHISVTKGRLAGRAFPRKRHSRDFFPQTHRIPSAASRIQNYPLHCRTLALHGNACGSRHTCPGAVGPVCGRMAHSFALAAGYQAKWCCLRTSSTSVGCRVGTGHAPRSHFTRTRPASTLAAKNQPNDRVGGDFRVVVVKRCPDLVLRVLSPLPFSLPGNLPAENRGPQSNH